MGRVARVFVLGVLGVMGLIEMSLSQQENTVIAEEVEKGSPSLNPQNFNPTVTASCRLAAGLMSVHVNTVSPFYGRVLTRTSSSTSTPSNPCSKDGEGALETTLTLNMIANVNDTDYCGVQHNKIKNTYSVAISVRLHKTLELAEDKQYIVTCNKAQTSSPIRSPVRLKVSSVESGRELGNTYYGRSYNLGVEVFDRGFRVRECVAFGNNGTGVIVLFDESGCPESRIVSRWRYDNPTTATTTIYSMFRFENSKRLTIQCVVYLCEEPDCSEIRDSSPDSCPTIPAPLIGSPSARFQFQRDTNDSSAQGSGSVLTSLTMNVLDVGEGGGGEDTKDLLVYEPDQCYGSICPRWLLWLVITLGILFLLMLLVNCFLCSALTCTCSRNEIIEREPSVIVEDYDPYRQSWTGSQFGGSRYSLNPPQSQLSGVNGHGKYH